MIENTEWMSDANCASVDADLFFAPKGQYRMTQAARLVCRACIVQNECLDYALKHPELEGVWANTNIRDRAKARRKA